MDGGTTQAIGRIDPDQERITEFTSASPGVALGIAAGPDGNLWFGDKARPRRSTR